MATCRMPLRTLRHGLESLLRQAMKETDPSKCNDLAAEIWRVLEEHIIERFSEDIDIFLDPRAFQPPLGKNAIDRVDNLRQHIAEILLFRRHSEQDTLGAHVPVISLDIGDGERPLA